MEFDQEAFESSLEEFFKGHTEAQMARELEMALLNKGFTLYKGAMNSWFVLFPGYHDCRTIIDRDGKEADQFYGPEGSKIDILKEAFAENCRDFFENYSEVIW